MRDRVFYYPAKLERSESEAWVDSCNLKQLEVICNLECSPPPPLNQLNPVAAADLGGSLGRQVARTCQDICFPEEFGMPGGY